MVDISVVTSDETAIEEQVDTVSLQKRIKIDKEKAELLSSLSAADFTGQRTRVAYVLNLYPQARNSDVTLALRYWEIFQSDIYNPAGILPKDLFRLERLHYLVRARAKIQNEYGLFRAEGEIQRRRRQHEEAMFDSVTRDEAPRHVVNVYSDETGKNGQFLIVASVWVLNGRSVFSLSKAIAEWKSKSAWANREVHFTKFGRRDAEPLAEYLNVILANREFVGFKAIAVENSRLRRSVEDVLHKLHEYMICEGFNHEVRTNRVLVNQSISVTLDDEQSLDAISLADLKLNVNTRLRNDHGEVVSVDSLSAVSSRDSPLVQLADLVAGALNRKLNNVGEINYKDEMADRIIQVLGLALGEGTVDGVDASLLMKI
ncbi:DUF3800 domain-containing protein [Pseudomonas sediminis]|uniref:DUF3800 domain-containing protein n=1 Tax=Pseudomonas sediminis TaxID=1691904 RepID=UPI0017AB653A|nr:DUF3800 domain-containing protein [Pseudomonas sediminis]